MRNKKNPMLLFVLLLFGALIGGIAGEFLSRYPYMSWMSFGGVNGYRDLFSFSLNPALDFRVIRFGFNLALKVNFGSVVGIILAFFVFLKI
jgi:hypothetical protein